MTNENSNAKTTATFADDVKVNGSWQGVGRLDNLVAELERQKDSKLDFVADARSIAVTEGLKVVPADFGQDYNPVNEFVADSEGLGLTWRGARQMGSRVSPNVPATFLRSMFDRHPDMASSMLTGLLHRTGKKNLIRVLDGRVRAFLSDQFRIMDNFDIAVALLDAARDRGGRIVKCGLSDARMNIELTTNEVAAKLTQRNGGGNSDFHARIGWDGAGADADTLHPFVRATNSEVGEGSLSIAVGVFNGHCANGLIFDKAVQQVHLGGKLDRGIYSDETREADVHSIMLKARDVITAAFNPDQFQTMIDKAREAQGDVIAQPSLAVDNLIKNTAVAESMRDNVLQHFLADYDKTRYGLAQAVSRAAQDLDHTDADSIDTYQTVAGSVVTTPAVIA